MSNNLISVLGEAPGTFERPANMTDANAAYLELLNKLHRLTSRNHDDEQYDYKGALLFVVGLLSMYLFAILLLIVSLIVKSQRTLEVKDNLRDFEAMERASLKRSLLRQNRGSKGSSARSVSSVAPDRQSGICSLTLVGVSPAAPNVSHQL